MITLAAISVILVAGGQPLSKEIEMAAATSAYCAGIWKGFEKAQKAGVEMPQETDFHSMFQRASSAALAYRKAEAPSDKELSKKHLQMTTHALRDTISMITEEGSATMEDASNIASNVLDRWTPECSAAVERVETLYD